MKVTIVIPLRNEEKCIIDFLESVVNQDYPKDKFEVIIIDGQSEDKSKEIIECYLEKFPFIRLFDNPEKIVPIAMNLGIKAATGDLIVRMDAHAVYAPNYISKCVEWSEKTKADNVGGPALAIGQGYVGKAIEYAHWSSFGLGGAKFRTSSYCGYVDTVFLGAFRREVFDKVGLYNPRLVRNQDIELNHRINASGGRCYLTNEIRVEYYCRSNLLDLWRQNFKNGVWNIYTLSITKNALSLRHFVPLIFVLTLSVSSLLAIVGIAIRDNSLAVLFVLIFGLYTFVNILFSFLISLKKGMKYMPILPAVFATLHVSYGIGSLKGLLTLKKWTKLLS